MSDECVWTEGSLSLQAKLISRFANEIECMTALVMLRICFVDYRWVHDMSYPGEVGATSLCLVESSP